MAVFGQPRAPRDVATARRMYDEARSLSWREAARLLNPHEMNAVRPWFLRLQDEAEGMLLAPPHQLCAADTLHSMKRIMMDILLNTIELALVWKVRGKRDEYDDRFGAQIRFRPSGRASLKHFPTVCLLTRP